MPTYEYECDTCGLKFERRQAITEQPITVCPECRGTVQRLISGGAGFILRSSMNSRAGAPAKWCSLELALRTCCGREERCGQPACGDK
jgi:putative FmdB family regulatory protein